MTHPLVIGIRGKKQAGKDYAYACIFHILAGAAIESNRRGFADALKKEIADAYRCTVPFINEHKEEFRLIMQGWGQSKRKLVREDYWIKQWESWYHGYTSIRVNHVIIIPDVRHKNELAYLESLGAPIIQVVAINKPQDEFQELDTHASETELDDVPCKIVLTNDFLDRKKLMYDLKTQLKKLGYPIQ